MRQYEGLLPYAIILIKAHRAAVSIMAKECYFYYPITPIFQYVFLPKYFSS